MVVGSWQWWWGEELRYDDNGHYWEMYGLYIMGCAFIGYSKLILVEEVGRG